MGKVLPLLALRAFAETGRRGSVKQAADVMGVTPGAVSQQIRLLEDQVRVKLFTRTRYGVSLTEEGARVHPGLMRAFDQIEAGLQALEELTARQTITVSTVPSFAASWLVPRLGRFSALYPGVEIRVEASPNLVDLRRNRVDVAIRHGLGHYPGLDTMHLMAPALIPVASPALLRDGPPIREPADCLAYTLLQDSDRADWRLWLQSFGVMEDARIERGPSYDDDFLLLRAAEAGHGLALVRDIYTREEIAAGRLAMAIDRPWPATFAYYAVTLPDARERSHIHNFIDWLVDEAAAAS